MYTKVFCLVFIACLVSLRSGECFEAKRFFGVGSRIPGDQLLVKDVQHSRPAGTDELPRVEFQYEIVEPITCVEILSEDNISAEVEFSLVNHRILGTVRMAASNQTDKYGEQEFTTLPPIAEFDVTIMVFGINGSIPNYDFSQIINRDQQFVGVLTSIESIESFDEAVEPFDYSRRDALEVDDEHEDVSAEEFEEDTEEPIASTDNFDSGNDIDIIRGKRQRGDQLLYDCYQTTNNDSKVPTNNSLIFYYIDTSYITCVHFTIFDHFAGRNYSDTNYLPPVIEFTHLSPGTLKAIITDFNSLSLYVVMFIYGYPASQVPETFVPFLPLRPLPDWQKAGLDRRTPMWTPMQKMQLLLMTGQITPPPESAVSDSGENDESHRTIRPDEMLFEHSDVATDDTSSALRLDQMDKGLGALLGLLLLILHN
ncbi:uncharacterized protein [Drosophila bipectinata]|uniref:uncharacterized protein n=1 Tax=Drosophila bipectinata TaxID=42026 RepID=UPI001C8A6807|nr:uncharacterized protein LOC108122088 [Drosophila bipectinata]